MAKRDEVDIVGGVGDYKDETVKRSPSKNLNRFTSYFTPKTRLMFIKLRKAFTKAPILIYFDPEYHIWIETDMLGYVIGRVLTQLTLDNLSQWHLVAYYLQKMIPDKTWYKTREDELLAIIKLFKT